MGKPEGSVLQVLSCIFQVLLVIKNKKLRILVNNLDMELKVLKKRWTNNLIWLSLIVGHGNQLEQDPVGGCLPSSSWYARLHLRYEICRPVQLYHTDGEKAH